VRTEQRQACKQSRTGLPWLIDRHHRRSSSAHRAFVMQPTARSTSQPPQLLQDNPVWHAQTARRWSPKVTRLIGQHWQHSSWRSGPPGSESHETVGEVTGCTAGPATDPIGASRALERHVHGEAGRQSAGMGESSSSNGVSPHVTAHCILLTNFRPCRRALSIGRPHRPARPGDIVRCCYGSPTPDDCQAVS